MQKLVLVLMVSLTMTAWADERLSIEPIIIFQQPTRFDASESLLESIGIYVGTQPINVVLRFSGWATIVTG